MTHFLSKLFNIRPTEWPRVLVLFLMIALTNAGALWGSTITYAAFLKQVGLEALPWVLVLSSALSILAIAIYTAFVDRIANDRLFVAIFAFGIVSIVLGLALLWLNMPSIAYPVLYLLFLAWVAVFNPHFFTYVNSFYDIQSAKRVLPVVSAGTRVGAIVAGLTMSLLTAWFAPSTIIVIWLLVYVMAMGLVGFMPYFLKEAGTQSDQSAYISPIAPTASPKQGLSYIDSMWEGFRYTIQSTYLRWMAIATLLLMVLMALVEYRSSGLLLEIYGTQEDLASSLALLVGVANIVVLPMLLFGLSRLIALLGLGNASLIFPAGNLVICGGLVLAPGLVSASAAYLDRTAFRITFQFPVDSLLYNAVPLRVKGRARAFVGGLIVPIGTLIGGLLLLLLLVLEVWWPVLALIGILAVAYLVSAFVIRQQYSRALVNMLEQEDYSFLLSQEVSDLTVADPATLTQLQRKLEESTSHELTIFIAKLISQVGDSKAIPILGATARAAQDARTRSALIDVLVAADLRGDALQQLYTDFLTDPDGRVRQAAIAGLEELVGPTDKQFLSRMLGMVQDPDLDVRVRALSALVHSGDFYRLTQAVQSLDQLLADEDPHRRAHGVRVLGEISSHRAVRDLTEYLSDPADEVRLEAAVSVESLLQYALPKLKAGGSRIDALIVEKMIPLLRDPIERVRQAALVVLGCVGTRESHHAMVDALADFSPQVRETAVDALAQVGKSIVPIVHPKLDSSDQQLRKMAIVTLSRVAPREFGSLIVGKNITGNLLTIYRNYGLVEALSPCTEYPSVSVLQSALREQSQQLADEIFYLLAAIHDPEAVKIISESLHSESRRARANAAEALESLTTPQIAGLIAPLFEPELPLARLLSVSKDTWGMDHPDTAQAIQQLAANPDDPWLRTITAFALGEIGAALSPRKERSLPGSSKLPPKEAIRTSDGAGVPEEDLQVAERPDATDTAGKSKKRRARRSPPADLLGVLVDIAEEDTDEEPDAPRQEEQKARRSPPADPLAALTDTPKAEAEGQSPAGAASPEGTGPPKGTGREKERRARRSPPADLLGVLTDIAEAESEDRPSEEAASSEGITPPKGTGREKKRRARRSPPADLFGVVMEVSDDAEASSPEDASPSEAEGTEGADRPLPFAMPQTGLTLPEIEAMLEASLADSVDEVRSAAQAATRAMVAGGFEAGLQISDVTKEEGILLSAIERIIFLKEVLFFQGMTIDQLKVLASACEEAFFEEDTRIFNQGDPGGGLYVVVSGRVGIEREKRKGSFARVATIEAHSYFGETSLFDNCPRSASAVAIQDTLTLQLRREPLIALARQYPDLSLELIKVLSARLREAQTRISELTRTRPRQLHKLFDQFE